VDKTVQKFPGRLSTDSNSAKPEKSKVMSKKGGQAWFLSNLTQSDGSGSKNFDPGRVGSAIYGLG